jgi:putative membrane protein
LVICMTLFHFYLLNLQGKFYSDDNRHSNRFYRLINEIPTVLMLLIVGLVILKP